MDIIIEKSELYGKIYMPSSKSQLHRAIIGAALSSGVSYIKNITICEDIRATINAVIALGADITFYIDKNTKMECIKIKGDNYKHINEVVIDCQDSATTFRFFLSIVAVLGLRTKFILSKNLMLRPFKGLVEELKKHGIKYQIDRKNKYIISTGKILGDDFFIQGDVSSQYISGLLMALPLVNGLTNEPIKLYATSELKSSSYVNVTLDILNRFGITININNNVYTIPINQKYKSLSIDIEGDYSIAANFLVAKNVNSPKLIVENINKNTLQGDKIITDVLNDIQTRNKILIDGDNCIDIIPILCVLFCYKNIECKIFNVNRLKIKESNRLSAICDSLKKLGGDINFTNNEIIIKGKGFLKGGVNVSGFKDHRIVMALAIAGLNSDEPIKISNCEYVNKSFPEFWSVLEGLNAKIFIDG